MEAETRTIVRKPCRKCGAPIEVDLTEELENADRARQRGAPALTRTEILASSAEHPVCPGDLPEKRTTKRIVTRVLVYEVPEEAEPEVVPVEVLERLLTTYETDHGEKGHAAIVGTFRVETSATTTIEAINAMSGTLSDHWNKLAGSVGLSEAEIIEGEGDVGSS